MFQYFPNEMCMQYVYDIQVTSIEAEAWKTTIDLSPWQTLMIYTWSTVDWIGNKLTFSPWGGMANCNSRTEGLTCSTCDRRTGYRRFCRGSAAVRSSCGMESSRWELMIIGFPRWNCLLFVRWGWPRRSASRWIGRWYGRKLLIRPFLNAIGIQLIAEDKDLDVPGKWESESHPIELGVDR